MATSCSFRLSSSSAMKRVCRQSAWDWRSGSTTTKRLVSPRFVGRKRAHPSTTIPSSSSSSSIRWLSTAPDARLLDTMWNPTEEHAILRASVRDFVQREVGFSFLVAEGLCADRISRSLAGLAGLAGPSAAYSEALPSRKKPLLCLHGILTLLPIISLSLFFSSLLGRTTSGLVQQRRTFQCSIVPSIGRFGIVKIDR